MKHDHYSTPINFVVAVGTLPVITGVSYASKSAGSLNSVRFTPGFGIAPRLMRFRVISVQGLGHRPGFQIRWRGNG